MGLNYDALKQEDQRLTKKGDGGSLIVYPKDIKDRTLWRVLPPAPSLGGILGFEVIVIWIDKTPFISRATFGKECISEAIIEEAKNMGDADIIELLNDSKRFSIDRQVWTAGLLLKEKADGKLAVVDNMIKILAAKPTLMKCINKCSYNKVAQKAGEWGIAERVGGWNLALSRTGSGRNTEYDAALDDQVAMPEKYYRYVLDVKEVAKNMLRTSKFLEAKLRQYLFGEEISDEVKEAEEERQKKFKEWYKGLMDKIQFGDKNVAKTSKTSSDEDDEGEEKPAPKKSLTKKKPAPVDDENDDDFEEQVTKVANKVSKKKPAPVDDENDDDFEEDLPFDKKGATKKPAPKKAASRKISDDIDDDDDFDDDDLDDL